MNGKALGGGRNLLIISVVSLTLVFAGLALAAEFGSHFLSDSTINASESPQSFSVMIENNDTNYAIVLLNITLPAGFTFVEGTDDSSAGSAPEFYNLSQNLTWVNSTLIDADGTRSFQFQATANTTPGVYDFIIGIEHSNDESNSTTIQFTVQDTTDPTDIILISPGNDTWINTSSVWINYSFTELNPDSCIYDNELSNTTSTASPDYCNISISGYSGGTWDYYLYVNDTSSNYGMNGTYVLKYDPDAPAISGLGVFNDSQNVSDDSIISRVNLTISANITDDLSGVSSAWADIYHDTAGFTTRVDLAGSGDTYNGTWQSNTFNNGSGTYTILVNATDNSGNTLSTGQATQVTFLGAPDLVISDIEWTSTNAAPGRPTASDDIILTVNVSNIGDGNADVPFNVSITINGGNPDNVTTIASLNQGQEFGYSVNFSSGNFSSNGLYEFSVEVDPEDAIAEVTNTNNTETLSLILGYNITLLEVDNGTDAFYPPEISKAFVDRNITVNVSVSYADGTAVTDLDASNNFTFSNTLSLGAGTEMLSSDRIYDVTHLGSGQYGFIYTTPGTFTNSNETRGYYGDNYLNVTAENGGYSGSGEVDYNITAPDVDVMVWGNGDDNSIDDIAMGTSSSKSIEINLTVTNYGNAPAFDIVIDEDDDWFYVSEFDINTPSQLTLSRLDPGESKTFEGIDFTVTGTQSGDDKNLFVYAHYNDSVDNEFVGFDSDRVKVTATEDEEDTGDTTTTGGGDSNFEFQLSFTDWDDEIDGYPGESNTTRVEVKNTGDLAAVVKVSFDCEPAESVAVAPTSKSVPVNARQEFVLGIDFSDDAEIGEYDCTVKAYVSTSTSDYDEEIILVKILPTEEGVSKINEEFQNISVQVLDMLARFERINPALVDGDNLTRVQNLMDNANESLNSIEEAIDDGDYITANELINALQASLLVAENSLSNLETEQTRGGGMAVSGTWFWVVIIIVVVVAVAFVAYLMFPQKSYGPKKNFLGGIMDSIRGGSSGLSKVKDSGKSRLGAMKKPAFNQARGMFKKQGFTPSTQSGPAAKIKGAVSKLKEKLKRSKRQKEVTSYFSNSSSKIIRYS